MSAAMGPQTQDFARMFVVPGMNHCRGGPATDSFDMLPQLVRWVEGGTAPESVTAKASTPAYFGVAARSRPLCPYPKQARYRGTGDINEARNFSCK
jgi:feruloyl esterase